jgi:hypothetical protein
VMDLFNRARVQKEFEERVVADAPRQIERLVTELIDWMIDQDFRQWQAITERLSEPTRRRGGARARCAGRGNISLRPNSPRRLRRPRGAASGGQL